MQQHINKNAKLETRGAYFLQRGVHALFALAREVGGFGVAGREHLAGVEAGETGFAIGPLGMR